MSNPDSFINEVTEEVRREQLYRYMRRYGWIGVLLIVLIVGGAGYNEWRKSRDAAQAQALGDAVFNALELEDEAARASALTGVASDGPARAVVGLLAAAEQERQGDIAGAVASLQQVSTDVAAGPLYRELAQLKSLILQADTMDPAQRRGALETLATPGAAFRLLAVEQIALSELAAGEVDAARTRLQSIVEDAEVTTGLRDRAASLLTAIGTAPASEAAPADDAVVNDDAVQEDATAE